jgi:hypothetical protein
VLPDEVLSKLSGELTPEDVVAIEKATALVKPEVVDAAVRDVAQALAQRTVGAEAVAVFAAVLGAVVKAGVKLAL